jgi:hypothetical protein
MEFSKEGALSPFFPPPHSFGHRWAVLGMTSPLSPYSAIPFSRSSALIEILESLWGETLLSGVGHILLSTYIESPQDCCFFWFLLFEPGIIANQ